MKKQHMTVAIVAAAIIIVAAGIWGGQTVLARQEAARLQALKSQQNDGLKPPQADDLDAVVLPSMLPVETATPMDSAAPAADPSPAVTSGVVVTDDGNGGQVITPDWQAKSDAAVAADAPEYGGGKAQANMGGAGGQMDLDKDGTYHGDHPDATPAPVQTPAATPKQTPTPEATPAATPQPTPNPDAEEPQPTPGSEPTNKPEPTQEGDKKPTPPDKSGTKDGEISPDGKYEWWDSFQQWVERGNGSYGIPVGEEGDTLTGNKVGNM